ncbi:MAG: DUF4340 domain-containing protein [Lachnospiraceae bacterium]|nr:DUF4340 domain-containing protein [Lachnospiraceae bacterium]
MKKQKLWMPLICLLALVLLLCAYFVLKHNNSKADEASSGSDDSSTITVTDIDTEKVNQIAFTIENQEVTFILQDGSWTIKGNEDFPLDTSKITTILSAAAKLSATRKFDDITELSEYGLDSPLNVMKLTTEDGATTTLTIGTAVNSSGSYAYLNDQTDTIYMIGSTISSGIPATMMSMALEDSFPTITTSNITSMEVKKPSDSFSLKTDSDTGNWNVTDASGDTSSAEYSEISTLESTVAGLTFTGLVDYKGEDLGQYGLETPDTVIRAHYTETVASDSSSDSTSSSSDSASSSSDSDSTSDSTSSSSSEEDKTTTVEKDLVLYVGQKTADGTGYYVRLDGSDDVHTMSGESIESITGMTAENYWSTSISSVSVNDISGVSITYNGTTKNITRTSEDTTDSDGKTTTTTTYSCDGKEIDSDAFGTFYNKLAAMAAQSKDRTLKSSNQTELTIVYHLDGGDETVTYTPYNENFYLAVDTEGRPGLVGKTTVKEMFTAYEALGL